jgi:hypothetical protein
MASMKSRFRPSHEAKLHMLAEPLAIIESKMTKNVIFTILFTLTVNSSFCQKIDSILIDKNLKYELLGGITPIEWITEGRMDLEEYYTFFSPIYLNNDTLVDFIYYGPSGAESFEVQIYLNKNNTLELIKSELGSIRKIEKSFPDAPTEIHFIQYGCCDDPHNYYQLWTLINNKIIEGEEYHFLNETEIPDEFKYRFSIRVNNTPYKLRATPEIIDGNFDYHYEKGNLIAEFSTGDIGHVLDLRKDETGRLWYFVVMEKPKREGYHNYKIFQNEKWMGWMSGRYTKIINNDR